jgi:adenylosuccinate synthase
MGDLLRPELLHEKLSAARRHYEQLCRGANVTPDVDWDQLVADLTAFGVRHKARIADVSLVLHRELARGYTVLFEGAQATLLDVDHGTYPYVTSSSGVAGGASVGLGVPLTAIDGSLGIAKAYVTRVGAGPFPTLIGGDLEEQIRRRGNEFGASTGRPRSCGWFDAVVTRYAMCVNGFDSLCITKLDVLDELPEIKVCTGYRYEGETLTDLPGDSFVLERCEPVYEILPGWKASTAGMRDFATLPAAAQRYLDRLSELVGVEIGMVSTGPDRNETIIRPKSAVASWFD